jgi:hypothetical protein
VPARVIKYRFPAEVIDQLLEIAWWDWDRATLVERFDELLDLDAFVAKHGRAAAAARTAAAGGEEEARP